MKKGRSAGSFLFLSLCIGMLLSLAAGGCSQTPWPTNRWKEKSGRNSGIDQERIEAMLDEIDQTGLDIDGLVVIYKGAIAAEKYFHVYQEETLHETYSVTKSIVSTLVGIAVNQGCIHDLSDQVLDYFPDREFLNMDEDKNNLTIRHLITMSSGLAYDPDQMYASMDWAQYTLDQPQIYSPGETWFYSNGSPQVLSALISQACEMDTVEFAEHYLFDPLGIRNFEWQRGSNGHPNGSWGLELTPRDMAKIGYLYLMGGIWDGEQILPEGWVDASTRPYYRIPDPLEPWDLYYGYMWWIHGGGIYAAHGYKGQFIYLLPDQEMVVVITGNIADEQFIIPQLLIRDYLIPAVVD